MQPIERLESSEDVNDINGLVVRKNGGIVINKKTELMEDLGSLPFPAYDLLPIEKYIRTKSPQGAWRGRFLPIIPTGAATTGANLALLLLCGMCYDEPDHPKTLWMRWSLFIAD
ncbi:MAG: hypothetical protein SWO11_03985 [Thermodesulfobacteriota bacterium]|nr:hypothetical protein [Thermodesulfobacteriota bacterium]